MPLNNDDVYCICVNMYRGLIGAKKHSVKWKTIKGDDGVHSKLLMSYQDTSSTSRQNTSIIVDIPPHLFAITYISSPQSRIIDWLFSVYLANKYRLSAHISSLEVSHHYHYNLSLSSSSPLSSSNTLVTPYESTIQSGLVNLEEWIDMTIQQQLKSIADLSMSSKSSSSSLSSSSFSSLSSTPAATLLTIHGDEYYTSFFSLLCQDEYTDAIQRLLCFKNDTLPHIRHKKDHVYIGIYLPDSSVSSLSSSSSTTNTTNTVTLLQQLQWLHRLISDTLSPSYFIVTLYSSLSSQEEFTHLEQWCNEHHIWLDTLEGHMNQAGALYSFLNSDILITSFYPLVPPSSSSSSSSSSPLQPVIVFHPPCAVLSLHDQQWSTHHPNITVEHMLNQLGERLKREAEKLTSIEC